MPQETTLTYIDVNGDTIKHVIITPANKKQENPDGPLTYLGGLAIVMMIAVILWWLGKKGRRNASAPVVQAPPHEPGALIYYGNDLRFSDVELDKILTKHLVYYTQLEDTEQERFRHRVNLFMQSRVFVIYAEIGFREMPILLSATAVKLSFGLKYFLLPFYKSIHVFPEEFIGTAPTIRVLAGNVSGNRIHVSWKHFLEGIKEPYDGSNLGLHEMAHAYYFQNFETGTPEDASFVKYFHDFNTYGNQVFEEKRITGDVLYSKYAMTHFQEFWAESIELFFEKSHHFKSIYPELYRIVSKILNQDPAKNADPTA